MQELLDILWDHGFSARIHRALVGGVDHLEVGGVVIEATRRAVYRFLGY